MSKFNLNSLLSNTGKKKAIDKKDRVLQITSISVFDLIASEDNFYSTEDIEELKDSIEMFGIKQNLTVKELENGKYMVIAGHRRRLASLALVNEGKMEFEFVPCVIETELDYIKEQLLLITTNATARQLTNYEKTKQAEKMKELLEQYKKREKIPGRIRELIAKALRTSPSQIGRMESISKKLTPDFKEEFKEAKINMSTAYELSTLPETAQKVVFTEYEENGSISIKEVKEKKEQIKKEEKNKTREQALPQLPTVYEILKGMSMEELAKFMCDRCDGVGRLCDYAIECNQREEKDCHSLCIKWLKTQAQKRG